MIFQWTLPIKEEFALTLLKKNPIMTMEGVGTVVSGCPETERKT